MTRATDSIIFDAEALTEHLNGAEIDRKQMIMVLDHICWMARCIQERDKDVN